MSPRAFAALLISAASPYIWMFAFAYMGALGHYGAPLVCAVAFFWYVSKLPPLSVIYTTVVGALLLAGSAYYLEKSIVIWR